MNDRIRWGLVLVCVAAIVGVFWVASLSDDAEPAIAAILAAIGLGSIAFGLAQNSSWRKPSGS